MMNMQSPSTQSIRESIKNSIEVKQLILESTPLISSLSRLAYEGIKSIKNGGKIIFAGNGGSFADAQHLCAEFVARFQKDRAPLPSIVLGANNSTLSAIGNDFGYEFVFSRELQALGKKQDILIAFSTSGNSLNIINLVKSSQAAGINTWLLTGASGGEVSSLCNCINVPSSNTARIQESHIMIGHIFCELIEDELLNG